MLQHFVMTEMMVVMVVVMMIIRGQGHDPKTRAGTCRVDLEIWQPADPFFSLDLLRDVLELLGHRVPIIIYMC